MYIPFSDSKNVDVMIRIITVLVEQETLEIDLDIKSPFYGIPINYGKWVKYVSDKSSNNNKTFIYWDTKSELEFTQRLTIKLLKDDEFFNEMEEYFLTSYKRMRIFTDSLYTKKDLVKLTNKELIDLFIKFNKYNRSAMSGYYIVYYGLEVLGQLVEKETKGFGEEYSKEVATLAVQSIVEAEKIAFLTTLGKIQDLLRINSDWQDNKIQRLICDHWYFYSACIYAHETNKAYTLKEYQKKFKDNVLFDAKKELSNLKEIRQKESKTLNSLLTRVANIKELQKHIEWLRKMMGYRNKDELYYLSYFDHASPLFKEISKRLKISFDKEIWLLSKQDIIAGLKGGLDVKVIATERFEKGFSIKEMDGEITVYTGVKDEDLHRVLEDKQDTVNLIKGKIACQGSAQGLVKLIFNPTLEGDKFNRGDILVTSMTTPDFVPLMKKAAAVITDEGGLLCHAAIISRELGVPCIIGTKFATINLKDNDYVKVNEGIIQVLENRS